MLRRDFVTLLAGAVIGGSGVASAQAAPSKAYRLGTLLLGAALDEKTALGATLLKKLDQHGYTLGKNLPSNRRSQS